MKKLIISLTFLVSSLTFNTHSFAGDIDQSGSSGGTVQICPPPTNCEPLPAPRQPE